MSITTTVSRQKSRSQRARSAARTGHLIPSIVDGIAPHTSLLPHDVKLVRERLRGFVPRDVFDIHAHLLHSRHFTKNPILWLRDGSVFGYDAFAKAQARWLPARRVHGLFFGFPRAQNDRQLINEWIAEQVRQRASAESRALILVAPEENPSQVEAQVRRLGAVGLKPYHCYAALADTPQATIEQFAPEWMWRICHNMNGVLMLHIVRDSAIADRKNQAMLRRLCEKYPRCRLVLAHVARSFNYRNARDAFQVLSNLDNAWVDTAAVTESAAMRKAIETLGPRRVLYGSDFPISEFRGKCASAGNGFLWAYAETSRVDGYPKKEGMTLVGIESLLCLHEACEDCGLTAADIRDIFHDNAIRLLSPHLPASAVAAEPKGPELWSAARQKISGGTGLLSKRAEMFDPQSWPSYFSRCLGCEIWDLRGTRYVDFTGGVGAVLLGYADPDVNRAVRRRINLGTYATLVSPDEVELAGLLLELHPWAKRVRYARGGGDAMGVAVRVARAATGRSGIAFCGYHGWQDWYLAANLADQSSLDGHLLPGLQPLGVPRELQGTAIPFRYNDLASFDEALNRLDGRLAAVVMEPMRSQFPKDGFLQIVAERCRAAGGVLVVDEITSGWRHGFPGALTRLKVEPDLAVYAKAMSNGFPCAAIVGRESVMDAANGSFISSSYWTDGVGPAAAVACIRKIRDLKAQPHVWKLGETLRTGLDALAARHPISKFKAGGMPCAPSLAFDLGADAPAAKAILIRRMISRGYLVSGQWYLMLAHQPAHIQGVLEAMEPVLEEISRLISEQRLQAEAGTLPSTGFTRLA